MGKPKIAVSRTTNTDDYLASLTRAGADPVVVDATTPIGDTFWQTIHGVVLTGGPDVDPALYGESPDPAFDPAPAGRDAFEIELVTRAIERDLPVLAICRGIQVLNVAAGGTLVQHIPGDIPQPLGHQLRTPAWQIAHEVTLQAGSQLAASVARGADTGRLPVNSRHHQAVKHVAPGFVAVATADDGVIEGIERPASRYCLGVQWHPENFWRTGEFNTLFQSFVDACR